MKLVKVYVNNFYVGKIEATAQEINKMIANKNIKVVEV